MPIASLRGGVRRRSLLQAGLAVGVSQIASPFVLTARAADAVGLGQSWLGSIRTVPYDRMADGRQMNPDLMRAPRLRI